MAILEYFYSFTTSEILLAFIITLLCILFLRTWLESRSLPPGPWGFPLVGIVPLFEKDLHLTFNKCAEKYGNIYSFRMGNMLMIGVNGYDTVRDILVKYPGEVFHGKPKYFTFLGWFNDFQGVMEETGSVWRDQRRFLLSTLRDFGFGKTTVATNIKLECERLVNILQLKEGQPIDPELILANFSTNVICALVLGERFEYDDPTIRKLREILSIKEMPKKSLILMALPWLRFLPFPSLFGWDLMELTKKTIRDFINEKIQQHRDSLDENNPRDLIDAYLLEAKKVGHNSWMTDGRLTSNTLILFMAGQSSVTYTLYWAIRLMMQYPEIQKKVQEEIANVVGDQRFPDWNDRSDLPFTEATIMEVQRYGAVTSLNVPHCVTEDVHMNGFIIPAGALMMANLHSCLHDPKYWENPDKFDPNHFLNKEGKVIKNEAFIPFSAGKRVCLGESLAKMEIFLLFSALLQHFTFQPQEGVKLESIQAKSLFDGRYPGSYQVCAIPRL